MNGDPSSVFVCGLVGEVLLGFYERTLRERTRGGRGKGRRKLQSGTVTAVQRVSSGLRLNPHLHVLALDGVYGAHGEAVRRAYDDFLELAKLVASRAGGTVQ